MNEFPRYPVDATVLALRRFPSAVPEEARSLAAPEAFKVEAFKVPVATNGQKSV
jgi:hypothetical protein